MPTPRQLQFYRCLNLAGLTLQAGFIVSLAICWCIFSDEGTHGNRSPLANYFMGLVTAWVLNFIALIGAFQVVGPAGRRIFIWHFACMAIFVLLVIFLPAINRVRE